MSRAPSESDPFDQFGPVSPDRPAEKVWIPRDKASFFPGPVGEAHHPKAWAWPAWLAGSEARWLRTLERLYTLPVAFPAAMSPETGLLLFSLVRNIRPRTVIEVGSFVGVSTVWIAAALEEIGDAHATSGDEQERVGALVSIDDFGPLPETQWRRASVTGDRQALVQSHIEEAGLAHRVHLEKGISWEVLPRIRPQLRRPTAIATRVFNQISAR